MLQVVVLPGRAVLKDNSLKSSVVYLSINSITDYYSCSRYNAIYNSHQIKFL